MTNPEVRQFTIERSIRWNKKIGSTTMIEYVPGNGTRYEMVFNDLDAFARYRDIAGAIGVAEGKPCVLVTWVNAVHSPSLLVAPGFLHYSRVRDKMRTTPVDAVVLAELIAHVVDGVDAVSTEEYLSSLSRR